MMDNGMQVLVGPTTTGASIAVADACYTDRTFMLTPSASSTDVTAGKDNVFQVCFTDPNQGVCAADYMAEHYADRQDRRHLPQRRRLLSGHPRCFREGSGRQRASPSSIRAPLHSIPPPTSPFSSPLRRLPAPTSSSFPIYYQPASVIFAQAKAMGYAPTFFGVDGMDGILDMPGFDVSLAEGLVLMTPFCATVESSKSFVDAYVAAYGTKPNQFEPMPTTVCTSSRKRSPPFAPPTWPKRSGHRFNHDLY